MGKKTYPQRNNLRFVPRFIKQTSHGTQRERGQAIIITAIAFMAMLAFAGLVTDAGTLYLNYTRLKRALDAAAVAAANQIRDSSLPAAQRKSLIRESAREMLILNNISDIYSLETYICEDLGIPANFASLCPAPGELKRKLAWIQATQNSPVYFLHLFGVTNIPITTHSVGEAASLDVVIVIDTSESMGSETPGFSNDFDPTACNAANSCQPLRDAKDSANAMINKFFDGYDRIAIVTYDVQATVHDPDLSSAEVLEADHTAVQNTINAIQLIDGPSPADILAFGDARYGVVNPMDLNGNGVYYEPKDIIGSTCAGCGMRVAGDILAAQGRVDTVWVIVFLSDGATNVSDLPETSPDVPVGYVNGYCGGAVGARLWTNEPSTAYTWCNDSDPATRHCGPYHGDATECPDGAAWVGNSSPPYDTEDYARDMTDRVGLVYPLYPADSNEPKSGDEVAIYAIGLGKAADPPDYDGEQLLRYMANIGDDNFRNPVPDDLLDAIPADPCDGAAPQTSCGQYYYAPSGAYLIQIFEKVAGSIFTRITQ
ncbi:MAG: VWA domain-containing protein [Anaerolineales bacterium]|nr:VWA domain-containing protein [Anaerolineales bacterium]